MLTNKLDPIPVAPGAFLPVLFDFDDWAATEGVSVASYTLDAETGITMSNDTRAGNEITAWFTVGSALAEGVRLMVTCTVTGSGSPARSDTRGALFVVTRL